MNFDHIYNEIAPKLGAFLAVFFVVMLIGYGFLHLIDFIPEPITTENNTPETVSETNLAFEVTEGTENIEEVTAAPMPQQIQIPALDRTVTVLNPMSADVTTLDNALLSGVVRHPSSADFSTPGNMLIMGHSSYLKNVFNKNFQAFNGLQSLTWGDTIVVTSADTKYTYQVDKVYKAPASAVTVPTSGQTYKLTLVTCNTFGAKEDRFIVEASLVNKKAL